MTWKPSPREGFDLLALPLDPLQGYLLSRLDGTLDLPTLAALMSMDRDQVTALLEALVEFGAVVPETPSQPSAQPSPPEPDSPEEDTEESPLAAARTATHRQLFEQHLHHRPLDQRVAQAQVAVEPDLSAWCFDPTAEVIRALLENSRIGGVHARLIATHHRTTAGLEALGARPAFTSDGGVRRALLQNPLLPPGLYRRLWSSKRLLEQYLVTTSRDVPEQTRTMARDALRASFNQRGGEERVELILTTEGRCLGTLTGLTIDGHTTALLCRRTYVSTLLIQNIGRWSAAPPQLIAHLRRQDVVRRNPALRQLLERHPNAS
ncbi:MAG TPA: hypothetical protein VF378_02790 [Geothrix sp.]